MRSSTPVRLALLILALSILALWGVVSQASAQPLSVASERTDNDFSFTYDSTSGEISTQTSRRETTRGDEVSFEVFIYEAGDGGPGLSGKLKLRLDGDQHTVYDGWFSMKVTEEEGGGVYYERFRPATIHLRPRPGQRTAVITYRFDLPTGSYRAVGAFTQE